MITIDLPSLIEKCAPNVAFNTMSAIIKTESRKNPLAIGINGRFRLKYQANNLQQAKSWVDYLEVHHYDFDVGLAQVNIRNIHHYGFKAHDMLNPCSNLYLASEILRQNYSLALVKSNSNQEALRKAISSYNTGNTQAGFYNGYVNKVIHNAVTESNVYSQISSNQSYQPNRTIIYTSPTLNVKDFQHVEN